MANVLDENYWADLWMRTIKDHPEVALDRETMLGWAANILMAGYDYGRNEIALIEEEPIDEEPWGEYVNLPSE